MNTSYQTKTMTKTYTDRLANILSPETRQLVSLGQEHGWDFSVLGQAPLPSEPVRLGDWLIVPAHQDSSDIPDRAYERLQAIFTSGLRPKGFVMVHEAPKLLPAPGQEQANRLQMSALPPKVKSTLKLVSGALGVLAISVVVVTGLAIIAIAALFLAGLLAVPAFLVVGAVVVDPILVAVTEDEYWVEIDRWII